MIFYKYRKQQYTKGENNMKKVKEFDRLALKEYRKNHFKGKKWNEVDKNDWNFYERWFKDVYGYLPIMPKMI